MAIMDQNQRISEISSNKCIHQVWNGLVSQRTVGVFWNEPFSAIFQPLEDWKLANGAKNWIISGNTIQKNAYTKCIWLITLQDDVWKLNFKHQKASIRPTQPQMESEILNPTPKIVENTRTSPWRPSSGLPSRYPTIRPGCENQSESWAGTDLCLRVSTARQGWEGTTKGWTPRSSCQVALSLSKHRIPCTPWSDGKHLEISVKAFLPLQHSWIIPEYLSEGCIYQIWSQLDEHFSR